MSKDRSDSDTTATFTGPGVEYTPIFCIRYQNESMARSKPIRLTHVEGRTLCVGRPFLLEKDQECRLLLYCKSPAISCWADGVVTAPPPPFEKYPTFKGIRLIGQSHFQIEDYLQAVGQSMKTFFQDFEQYQFFDLADCEAIARLAGTRELQKEEVLYQAGVRSPDENDLYMVTGGTLKAYKLDARNPADNIAALNVGQLLGEMSLVIDQPHSASIAALRHAWLIQFSRTGLHELEFLNPRLYIKMYKLIAQTLVRRLARTTRRWKEESNQS